MQSQDKFFEFGGNRLRYRDSGHGDESDGAQSQGPAIVFLHGWTLDLDVWEPQAAELARSFRVIRLDRRGFGLSSGRPGSADDVRDLRGLLDLLGLPKVTVVGMSQGARAALSFALASPDRISGLVLDGPPSYAASSETGADEDLSFARYRELVRTAGIDAFRREWQDHPFVRLRTNDPDARKLLTRMLARYPGRDLDESPPIANQAIDARSLTTLHKPVLVLNGEFDTDSRKRAGDVLHRTLPLAARVLVPNAGHLSNLDNPQIYNDLIRDFVQHQARAAA